MVRCKIAQAMANAGIRPSASRDTDSLLASHSSDRFRDV
jgi:hypothetical protein